MLGHQIYCELQGYGFDVWAGVRRTREEILTIPLFDDARIWDNMSFSDEATFLKRLNDCSPDVILNCIGLTTRKIEPNNNAELIRANSLLPHFLNDWCGKNGRYLIHFSTDCVFSGKTGNYTENSIKDAKDLYGQSKAAGEVSGDYALTLRTSIIGLELFGKTELLEWFLSQKGNNIKGYSKVIYSGVTTNFLAYVVGCILQFPERLTGVLQIASEPISKFELLSLANEVFENDCSIEPDASVISDKSLNGQEFFKKTNIKTPSWPEMLSVINRQRSRNYQLSKLGRAS